MFKNKTKDNKNNICGAQIKTLRIRFNLSQKELADKLQLMDLDIDKNAIQRIECGKRFVTDIELEAFCRFFKSTADELLFP